MLLPCLVNAVDLCIGSELVDNNGNTIAVEQIFHEDLHDETADVYNFQVEDYHTYFAGKNVILVHNAGGYDRSQKYSKGWADESLSDTVDKIAPNSKPTTTNTGKTI